MKKLILLLIILNSQFSILNSFCQPTIQWEKSLGGTYIDNAYSIKQTFDSGYIVAGSSSSIDGDVSGNHGAGDAWLVKLDYAGIIQWQHCYGGTNWEWSASIIQTTDSGYVFTGYTASNNDDVSANHGGDDYWVVKINDTGTIQWSKCYGGSGQDYAASIIQTYDGGYAVAGYTYSTNGDVTNNHGNEDYWVVKLNDTGAIQWHRCYGGIGADIAYNITQARDSGFVIVGNTASSDGDFMGTNSGSGGIGIIKTDLSGNVQWSKCLGTGADYGLSVIQTLDGGFTVGGYGGGAFGGWDYLVYKLSDTGSVQWSNSYGGSGDDWGTSIIQLYDGSYVMAGYSGSTDDEVTGNHGGWDYWVLKLNNSGAIIWEQSYGGSYDEVLNSLIATNDGGYALAGISESNDGEVSGHHGGVGNSQDFWVVKLNPDVTTGIDQISTKSSYISIYPNPSDGNLNLDYQLPSGKGELIMTDIAGRVVYSLNISGISGTQKINVADFVNGIYYWKIISGNDVPPNGKIVLLK